MALHGNDDNPLFFHKERRNKRFRDRLASTSSKKKKKGKSNKLARNTDDDQDAF